MSRYFSWILVGVFLLYSIPGLLPIRLVPHDHVLFGQVTPEQLRAHEEQEAAADGSALVAPVPLLSKLVVTPTGGLIISVTPPGDIIGIPLQPEIALVLTTVLLVLEFCAAVVLPQLHGRSLMLPASDPPPRRAPTRRF